MNEKNSAHRVRNHWRDTADTKQKFVGFCLFWINSYEEESLSSPIDLRPAEEVFLSPQLCFIFFQHISQTVAAHRLSDITQEAPGWRLATPLDPHPAIKRHFIPFLMWKLPQIKTLQRKVWLKRINIRDETKSGATSWIINPTRLASLRAGSSPSRAVDD